MPQQKDSKPVTESTSTEQSDEQTKESVSSALVESHTPHPVGNQNDSHQEKHHQLEWWKFIMEILTLLVIFAYTTITYRQWNTMQTANELATRSLYLSNRPWIGVSPNGIRDLDVGKMPTIDLIMENFGNSPGIATSRHAITLVPRTYPTEKLVSKVATLIRRDIGAIWPGQKLASSATFQKPLTIEEVNDIKNGKLTLMIFGVITYQGESPNPHHTWIEIVYLPDTNGLGLQHSEGAPRDD